MRMLVLLLAAFLPACGGPARPAPAPGAPLAPRALAAARPATAVTAMVVKQFRDGDYRPVDKVKGGELARIDATIRYEVPPPDLKAADPDEPYVLLEIRDQDGDRLGKVLVTGHPTPAGKGTVTRTDFVRIPTYTKSIHVAAPVFYQRRTAPAGQAGRRAEGEYEAQERPVSPI